MPPLDFDRFATRFPYPLVLPRGHVARPLAGRVDGAGSGERTGGGSDCLMWRISYVMSVCCLNRVS